jgi:hypothetical protein
VFLFYFSSFFDGGKKARKKKARKKRLKHNNSSKHHHHHHRQSFEIDGDSYFYESAQKKKLTQPTSEASLKKMLMTEEGIEPSIFRFEV